MSNPSKQQLSLEVLKKFRVIYGSVRQHFREIEQACGVSGSQLWILKEIGDTPEIGVSELANRLSIHQSTCSQLVEKLVGAQLVIKQRSTVDQRRVGLRLTPAAVKLLRKAPAPTEGVLPEAIASLSMDSVRSLDASLEKLILKLQESDANLGEEPLSNM